jgi:hypothetical protein
MDSIAIGQAFYVARACLPAPWSIYRPIFKLQPAQIPTLTLDKALRPSAVPLVATAYWFYCEVLRNGPADCSLAGQRDPNPVRMVFRVRTAMNRSSHGEKYLM